MAEQAVIHAAVPAASLTDALIAIERAREQGIYDAEQLERLGPLVEVLRHARERSIEEV